MFAIKAAVCASLFLVFAALATVSGRAAAAAPPAGEFGDRCAMGLAEGKRIDTDCSIHWASPDGKTYCFGSQDARKTFLKDADGNLQRAREYLAAGSAEATAKAMQYFEGDQVRAFVDGLIKAAADANAGIYPFADTVSGKRLELVFEKIDFMRTLHGYGFFPEVVFHAKEDAAKKYLIDYWVRPEAGKLVLMDARIYKAPRREGEAWKLVTRMPKPWWWIPASEHPGETEQVRGWEVMSAVDRHIVGKRAEAGGIYKLKDDKTGQEIPLEFIGIHQPVRKLKEDGRYFACTDFRRQGSTDEIYDIDFWLNDQDGSIAVGEVRVHKVPMQEDGSWTQVPRYNFDKLNFEVVP